jgi:hypothetical protein
MASADFTNLTVHEPAAQGPGMPSPGATGGLVGRSRELAQIVESLRAGESLVTVAGPGGAGKSTVARAVLAQVRALFPGGIAWVQLGGADDVDSALHRLHVAIDATGRDGIAPALAARGRTLTVLDAFDAPQESLEHQLAQWLQQVPDAAWLVTSRRTLGLPGERVVTVGAMSADEALALFVSRVHAVDPDFELGAEAAMARDLLGRLDRLPLAIELAASRAARVGVQALASLVEAAPLSLEQRVAGEDRHKRLEATIAWSVERLADTSFLYAVAVFRAAFELEAAAAVAGCTVAEAALALAMLADHHLLFRVEGGFRLFDTVRAFAERQTPRAVVERYRRHLVARATVLADDMLNGDAHAARVQLEAAADDLFAALHAAVTDAEVEAASRLAVGLARLSEPRDPATTERAVALALGMIAARRGPSDTERDAEARVLIARARVRYLHGDYLAGAIDAERAGELAASRETRRDALIVRERHRPRDRREERALARAEAALAVVRRHPVSERPGSSTWARRSTCSSATTTPSRTTSRSAGPGA